MTMDTEHVEFPPRGARRGPQWCDPEIRVAAGLIGAGLLWMCFGGAESIDLRRRDDRSGCCVGGWLGRQRCDQSDRRWRQRHDLSTAGSVAHGIADTLATAARDAAGSVQEAARTPAAPSMDSAAAAVKTSFLVGAPSRRELWRRYKTISASHSSVSRSCWARSVWRSAPASLRPLRRRTSKSEWMGNSGAALKDQVGSAVSGLTDGQQSGERDEVGGRRARTDAVGDHVASQGRGRQAAGRCGSRTRFRKSRIS